MHSVHAPLIQYQLSRGLWGAFLARVGTSASWCKSGVTKTDDCVEAASLEGFQSSSPPMPTTPWAMLSHAPYCNDLMLIQDQRPRASIYITEQETGTPPHPPRVCRLYCMSVFLYLCTWAPSCLCGCKGICAVQILRYLAFLFVSTDTEQISKQEVKFTKWERPPGWCVNAQLTVLPTGCVKQHRNHARGVNVLILILLRMNWSGTVWMTSFVIAHLTWLIVSFCAGKWKATLVKYSSKEHYLGCIRSCRKNIFKKKIHWTLIFNWLKERENIISLLLCQRSN